MRWAIIKKGPSPTAGKYSDWKGQLAIDCKCACIYCCIHESRFGGFRNFHVEHLRPKSKFKRLENRYENLFYACAVCNSFKGNDWPRVKKPIPRLVCYPDPSQYDYAEMIEISKGFSAKGRTTAGKYIVERLYLNRPHLILERRRARVEAALEQELKAIDQATADLRDDDLAALIKELTGMTRLLLETSRIRPYKPSDLER